VVVGDLGDDQIANAVAFVEVAIDGDLVRLDFNDPRIGDAGIVVLDLECLSGKLTVFLE